MFLPFLTYIFAMAGATALVSLPGSAASVPGWNTALALLLPLLLGWGIGLLPESLLGPRSPLRLTPRRWLTLLVWLGVVGATPLVEGLLAWLGNRAMAEESVLAVLLVDYWLADTLCLHPPQFPDESARVPKAGFLQVLRLPVPFLALVALGMGALGGLESWMGASPGGSGMTLLRGWAGMAGITGFYLLCIGLLMPVLIRVCWGLAPLTSRDAERLVEGELAANKVSVARVLAWPEGMTGFATAGVIGVLPHFRYLLFSESLLGALTPEEIQSVTAHEAAHLKYRHPWYFVAAMLAAILLVQAAWQASLLAGVWLGVEVPLWALAAGELLVLLLLLRVGFGFLSRHFERQADGHALRRQGLLAFQSAISKVSRLNGIPPELDNWHHHGIAHRVAYLLGAAHQPELLARHDRRVGWLKLACLGLLALGLAGQGLLTATPLAGGLVEGALERRVEGRMESQGKLGPKDLPGLNSLAALAYQRKDLPRAEKFYRMILDISPEDAQVENNLAWLLLTSEDPSEARIAEGLTLAKRASLAQDSAFIWDTLAEGYARGQQPALARAAAERALLLARAGKGRGEAALDYYQRRLDQFTHEDTKSSKGRRRTSRPTPPVPGAKPMGNALG